MPTREPLKEPEKAFKSVSLNKNIKSAPTSSTPKVIPTAINKELAYLKGLYTSGILNDNTQRPPELKPSTTSSQESNLINLENSCKMSPIITSSLKSTQSKFIRDNETQLSAFIETPKLENTVMMSDEGKNNLENINRNLNFDDTLAIGENDTTIGHKNSNESKQIADHVQNTDEDDELLAHVTKIESDNTSLLNNTKSRYDLESGNAQFSNSFVQVGFKTAKGAAISVKKNTLDSVASDFDDKIEENISSDGFIQVGFRTAKGSSIKVKKEALNSAINNFNEIKDPPNEDSNSNDGFVQVGFTTAKGSNIKVKKDALNSVISSFNEDIASTDGLVQVGFTTAKGSTISVKKDVLTSVINNYNAPDEDFNSNDGLVQVGFTTAKGSSIKVKKDTLNSAMTAFDSKDINEDTNDDFVKVGFSTAKGAEIKVKKNNLDKAVEDLSEHEFKMKNDDTSNDGLIQVGFTTAKGSSIKIARKNLDLAINNFNSEKMEQDIENSNPTENGFINVGFTTAKGSTIKVKKDTLNSVITTFNDAKDDDDADSAKPAKEELDSSSMTVNCGFKTATGKRIAVKEETLSLMKEKLKGDADLENSTAMDESKQMLPEPPKFNNPEFNIPKANSSKFNLPIADKSKAEPQRLLQRTPSGLGNTSMNQNESDKTRRVGMNNGKQFKRPQLVQKAKLNKYIDDDPNTTVNQSTLELNNLFENSLVRDEPTSNKISSSLSWSFYSKKLSNYVNDNLCLLNASRSKETTYLNVKSLELIQVADKPSNLLPSIQVNSSDLINTDFSVGFSTGSGKKITLSDKTKEVYKAKVEDFNKEIQNSDAMSICVDNQGASFADQRLSFRIKPILELKTIQVE